MNISKCPKCSKGLFQIESITPLGSNKIIYCVICQFCNSIVGTLDNLSTETDKQDTNLQIQVLNKKLDTINTNIGQIMNGVKLIYNKIEKVQNSEV